MKSNPYQPENEYILYGPLKEGVYQYAKTITFLVNPDQLSMLNCYSKFSSFPNFTINSNGCTILV